MSDLSGLTVSYSGIRGIAGEGLTPAVARRFGQAFRAFLLRRETHPKVLIARDTRTSGPELTAALVEGLQDLPRIDVGVVPTPTAQFAVSHLDVTGAVVVTASHNPLEWNGFKFMMGHPAMVLDGGEIRELMEILAEQTQPPELPASEGEDRHDQVLNEHRQAVLAQVDVASIRGRHFKVAYDSGQGAGRESTLALLETLGCQIVEVREPRQSEPIPENIGALARAVADHQADLGLAQDLDADRLALVTEEGRIPGEHFTLVLVLEHLLGSRGAATVVKNFSTTRAVDDLAERAHAQVIEVPVGEVNLSRVLGDSTQAGQTAFGGEGTGGVIYPPVGLGRDSLMGIALVLEALASQPLKLSQRLAQLPQYIQQQRKLKPTRELKEALQTLQAAFPQASASHADGLKLTLPDRSWLALRASNTEPIWRLMAEARSGPQVEELLSRALGLLS
jgi:phosphomannomutase